MAAATGTMATMGDPLDAAEHVLGDAFVEGLETLPMEELRARRGECEEVEVLASYLRRLVQGRMDIVHAEIRRRDGGELADLAGLVEQLPEILSEGPRGAGVGRLGTVLVPDVNHRRLTAELDRIIDADKVAVLGELSEDELRTLGDDLAALEQDVSARRRCIQERMDTLQAEIVRRYKSGEATVDSLFP